MIQSLTGHLILWGILAAIGSAALTYLVRHWALKVGFVDKPGHRKIHEKPIALGGGIAIFVTVTAPLVVVAILAAWWNTQGVPDWVPESVGIHVPGVAMRLREIVVLIAAITVLHAMGLADDIYNLGPRVKLIIQLLVALAITTIGATRFHFFIPSAPLAVLLSVLWITVIVNAFNFLDNMDGLSAGAAAICAAIILAAAWNSGQIFVSALLILLIGALLGFLIFNFNPAKIFMGDGGSLIVGFLVAIGTIRTTYFQEESPNNPWFSTFIPLVALAVPLYDFTSVVIIRLLQGRSPFVGDKQHFSHRLVNRGMTQRQAVLTIYLATAGTGLGAALLPQVPPIGAVLILVQTVCVVSIIAILERPSSPSLLP